MSSCTAFPWPVRLDRRVCVTGVWDEPNQWTTFDLPFIDGRISQIVLSCEFGERAGEVIVPNWINENRLYVYGDDISGKTVAVGRPYPASVELTRPFVRGQDGRADINAYLTLRQLTTTHHLSAGYRIAARYSRRGRIRTATFRDSDVSRGTLTGWFNGEAAGQQQFIIADGPRPFTITAIEHVADYEPRMSSR